MPIVFHAYCKGEALTTTENVRKDKEFKVKRHRENDLGTGSLSLGQAKPLKIHEDS